MLTPTLETMRDIGFLADVAKGRATLTILHVLGPTAASLDEVKNLKALVDFLSYFLVKNHINEFDWEPPGPDAAKPIDVACLSPTACAMVDAAAAGYDAFIANEGYSYVMRGRVRFWTERARALKTAMVKCVAPSGIIPRLAAF